MAAENPDPDTSTFEELLERLEALTAQLSSGEVGIERAADLYEEAGRVYAAARDRLAAVQERIDRLRASRPETGEAGAQ